MMGLTADIAYKHEPINFRRKVAFNTVCVSLGTFRINSSKGKNVKLTPKRKFTKPRSLDANQRINFKLSVTKM